LPRQARDKHCEKLREKWRFCWFQADQGAEREASVHTRPLDSEIEISSARWRRGRVVL
jgi:hypothetical protein